LFARKDQIDLQRHDHIPFESNGKHPGPLADTYWLASNQTGLSDRMLRPTTDHRIPDTDRRRLGTG